MTRLVRWRPFYDSLRLMNEMEQMFNDLTSWPEHRLALGSSWTLPLDVAEQEDAYVVKASIPGIDPDDVEITLSNNVLTIKGEVSEDQEVNEENYHLRERRHGHFSRSLNLPMAVDANAVEASYANGVLRVRIGKAEEARPKRIAIKGGGKQKVIEAKTA
jgi:HSP20 family protein